MKAVDFVLVFVFTMLVTLGMLVLIAEIVRWKQGRRRLWDVIEVGDNERDAKRVLIVRGQTIEEARRTACAYVPMSSKIQIRRHRRSIR